MKRKLLLFLLSALGFATACDDEKETVSMYAPPRIDFRIKGSVTNAEGKPLRGIEVRSLYDGSKTLTAFGGAYELPGTGFPGEIYVRFTDIDGPETYGQYSEQQFRLDFTEADRQEDGSYLRKMDVTLERE